MSDHMDLEDPINDVDTLAYLIGAVLDGAVNKTYSNHKKECAALYYLVTRLEIEAAKLSKMFYEA